MKLILKTIYKGERYTISHLFLGPTYLCDALEDRVRNLPDEVKVYGQTAIPAGIYKISLEYSPKFKRELPYLHDVPYFTGILIHAGNTDKDSAGCILVGENKVKGHVVNSRYWEKTITDLLREAEENGEKNEIEIIR